MSKIEKEEADLMKDVMERILMDNPYEMKPRKYNQVLDTIKLMRLFELVDSKQVTDYADGIRTRIILTRGKNFTEAKIKGPAKYIYEKEKKLNPTWLNERWEYVSNNGFLSGFIGGTINGFILLIMAKLLGV